MALPPITDASILMYRDLSLGATIETGTSYLTECPSSPVLYSEGPVSPPLVFYVLFCRFGPFVRIPSLCIFSLSLRFSLLLWYLQTFLEGQSAALPIIVY